MRTKKTTLLILIILLGIGSGYWWRFQKSASEKKQADLAAEKALPTRSTRDISESASLATQLQSNLKLVEGQNYWLNLIAGIEGAALDDLPKMALLVGDNPAALRILALRWIELDPGHLFKSLRENSTSMLDTLGRIDDKTARELYRLLFQEWPKTDLESASAAISSDARIPDLIRMQREFLSSLAEIDPVKSLETMRAWSGVWYGPDPRIFAEWAGRDPRSAVDAIITNDIGSYSHTILSTAASVWANSDPLAAMALARETEGKLGRVFRKAAFEQWLKNDLESAADWLADHDSLQLQDELRPAVIKEWAGKNPEAALEWTNANLKGRHQARAMKELIETVAVTDRKLAMNFFEKIAPGAARNEAARVIGEKLFRSDNNPEQSEQAIAWFKNLDSGARDSSFNYICNPWAATDPKSLKTYLLSEAGATLPNWQLEASTRELANQNPAEMLEWSENFPLQKQTIVARSALISWLRNQPQNAIKWFNEIPLNDERRPPMVEAYLQTVLYLDDTKAAERLRGLPKEDWKGLDEISLPSGRSERIKNLAEK